ncbi:MAG: hypothetical protein Q9P44_11770 [Anaerolineae bacterium]|nr:hypothetical protein [Anaerolineae bacterium]
MNSEIQSLLKSPLAEDRKRGVEMLAQSGDPDTLQILSALHKRERDVEIKQLIVEVGKAVKRQDDARGSFGSMIDDSYGELPDYYDFDDKPKRKSKFYEDDTSWATALMDVGLYGLVTGGAAFIMMMFFIFVLGNIFQEIVNSPTFNPTGDVRMAQIADSLSSLGLSLALFYGVLTAIFSMVFYVIWLGIVHLMATYALSGHGSYPGVLHRAFIPMVTWIIVSFVVGAVGGYVTFSSLANATTLDQIEAANAANGLMSLVNLVMLVGFSFWLSAKIGENYRFGTSKGCVSIILSYVAIFVVACGCIFFFSFVIASVFQAPTLGFIPLFF